jgi:hypothetical protein
MNDNDHSITGNELRGEQAGLPAIKSCNEPRHRSLRRITRKS